MGSISVVSNSTDSFCSFYPEVLTVRDVQDILNIGKNRAYALIEEGRIRSFRVGEKSLRVRKSELARFIRDAEH